MTGAGYQHVADLGRCCRDSDHEIRASLIENGGRYAVELRRFERNPKGGDFIAGKPGVIVHTTRIVEVIRVQEKGAQAASALREAAAA